ncbi:hypothetical protein ACGFNU_10940 [Spirillospora sp. NPDC048911]|uniref:hypothetical protein n=1 Tax=Spirillospora sp. NPDC048911 TaxID=3364527 RepID=UPI003723D1EC
MSGDQGPDARAGRSRPDFLPPADDRPPAVQPATEQAPETPPATAAAPGPVSSSGPVSSPDSGSDPAGTWWNIMVICAASALLVAAFLPWVRARVVVDAFGQTLTHDLGEAAGIEADGMVLAVPVLALTAVGMAVWGIAARDTRISFLTAVPGGLALLVCTLFLLRLDDASEGLGGESTLLPYDVTPAYGWYVSAAMSLLVLGFSLVRPLVDRGRRDGGQVRRQPHPPQQPDAAQQQYVNQQYASQGQQYAAPTYDTSAYDARSYDAWAYAEPYETYETQPSESGSQADGTPARKPEIDPGPPPS